MAELKHLAVLERGVPTWNAWRRQNPKLVPDLLEGNFGDATLEQVDFSGADLRGAHLANAKLIGANLNKADCYKASMWRANLTNADLREADLSSANLNGAILAGANLSGCILRFARLAAVNVEDATLSGCFVYACSIWNMKGVPKEQVNIAINPKSEPLITVDNIEIAQFIYLLVKNAKIREVIDSITSKVVLILGRFTPERKRALDAIRDQLRRSNYLPVLFDFEKPASRDLTETVSTLAHMARFIIVDITDAKSVPQELQSIVPNLPSVPVKPVLLASGREYGMFEHFKRYPWVLPAFVYEDENTLVSGLSDGVIKPAERAVSEIRGRAQPFR